MSRLEEGASRQMKKSSYLKGHTLDFKIEAECVDWDTPLVHITISDEDGKTVTASLGDFEVDELILQLKRALSILPTSK